MAFPSKSYLYETLQISSFILFYLLRKCVKGRGFTQTPVQKVTSSRVSWGTPGLSAPSLLWRWRRVSSTGSSLRISPSTPPQTTAASLGEYIITFWTNSVCKIHQDRLKNTVCLAFWGFAMYNVHVQCARQTVYKCTCSSIIICKPSTF